MPNTTLKPTQNSQWLCQYITMFVFLIASPVLNHTNAFDFRERTKRRFIQCCVATIHSSRKLSLGGVFRRGRNLVWMNDTPQQSMDTYMCVCTDIR